jgi:rhodanese-related sulfurtransferase
MGIISRLLGHKKKGAVSHYLSRGALVLDVRNPGEFAARSYPNSINIPLNELKNRLTELQNLDQPIIVCCASGVRSSLAKAVLEKEGLEVVNAGSWRMIPH